MWIATQEYPVSPPSLASPYLSLKLDTLSSDGSEAGTWGVPVVDPIVNSDQEFTVISVNSGDPDPDVSDEDRPSSFRIDWVSPTPSAVSAGVLESPSHYPTPAAPVDLSAVSCVLISPNRVRQDYSSGSLDADPVFEVSPDTAGFVHTTVPTGAESCLPLMMDGTMSYNLGLVDPESDVSLVMIPVYSMPAGMVLMPVPPSDQPSSSPICLSRWEAVSSSRDVSREGPFDAYCAPLDTGDHPLVSTGLPGCPYRMTSYAGTNATDVNPAYGIQIHHPHFL